MGKMMFGGRTFAILWVLILAAVIIWVAPRLTAGNAINADILSLLPEAVGEPLAISAARTFQGRLERQTAVLIGAPDRKSARIAARTVYSALFASGYFEELTLESPANMSRKALELYLPHRFSLLSGPWRARLAANKTSALQAEILARVYRPGSSISSKQLEFDPLFSLTSFLEALSPSDGHMRLEAGMLMTQQNERTYIMLTGTIAGSPFDLPLQEGLVRTFNKVRADIAIASPTADLLASGVVFHAAAGTASAKYEISRVGLGSLVGIILIFLFVFRSPLPLMLSALAISIGCFTGFAGTLMIFGQVHILALVFGASLVGIAVDYTLHYFCEWLRNDGAATSFSRLAHVRPGLTVGLATSTIGFGGLLATGFPAMQQVAVFSGAGLAAAYLSVLAFLPVLSKNLRAPKRTWPSEFSRRCCLFWQAPKRRWFLLTAGGCIAAFGIYGAFMQTPDDNIRLLQSRAPGLIAADAKIQTLVGPVLAQQFFVVSGRDEAELLERQEFVSEKLQALTENGGISGYIAFSDFVPSPKRQASNRGLLSIAAQMPNGLFDQVSTILGLPADLSARYRGAFSKAVAKPPLTLSTWLASPVSAPYRNLWLGQLGGGVAAVIGIRQPKDLHSLSSIARPDEGIYFVDTLGSLSKQFGVFRQLTLKLTAVAYLLVSLVLAVRYGGLGMVGIVSAPLLGTLASVGILHIIGENFSLFNAMALFLVLGVGVDFGIFFRESRRLIGVDIGPTCLAVAMSTVTTLLAFGLLAFSTTTAVHGFGLTVAIGILTAFLTAPLTSQLGRSPQSRGNE